MPHAPHLVHDSPALRALIAARHPLRLVAWVDRQLPLKFHHGLRIGYGHIIHPQWDRQLWGMSASHLTLLCEESRRAGRLTGPLHIEPDEAEDLLSEDLRQAGQFIHSVTRLHLIGQGDDLTERESAALAGLVYLTSQGRYALSGLRRALHAGDREGAEAKLAAFPDLLALWQGNGTDA